jgi:hypothetical protein
MRPYPYLSNFASGDADAARSIRAERLISRMFSQITTNQIGKSYKGTGLKAGPNEGSSLGPKPNEGTVRGSIKNSAETHIALNAENGFAFTSIRTARARKYCLREEVARLRRLLAVHSIPIAQLAAENRPLTKTGPATGRQGGAGKSEICAVSKPCFAGEKASTRVAGK